MDEEITEERAEERVEEPEPEAPQATIADLLNELREVRQQLERITANMAKQQPAPLPPRVSEGDGSERRKSIYDM